METVKCDVLVIGGGAAGSRAAYEAKRLFPDLRVALITAGNYGSSGSSNFVASESLGINAPFNFMEDGDSPDLFYEDIINTGGGLADPDLCRIIADESSDRLRELMQLGVQFDAVGGKPVQHQLSGCSRARSLTVGGSTGKRMVEVLKTAALQEEVEVFEEVRAVELITKDGAVWGAYCLYQGKTVAFLAGATVLATGGAGRAFSLNVNPPTLEGDGWAMAYRAGAKLINLEFFQTGPGTVNPPLDFIIHSHMWRFKPRLFNSRGEEFLVRYCPSGVTPEEVLELKAMSYPFSVRTDAKYLDIAIFTEIVEGRGTRNRGVIFDVTHVSSRDLHEKAPITYNTFLRAGVDLANQPVEIAPLVQNFNGGVLINGDGETTVRGLYCAGEVSGGVHGADRPGGNNLTDTQVFGYRAGRSAARRAAEVDYPELKLSVQSGDRKQQAENSRLLNQMAELFYTQLTIVRNKEGLNRVSEFLKEQKQPHGWECRNRLIIGDAIAAAALLRRESRGTHYREDYPASDPEFTRPVIIQRDAAGALRAEFKK